MLTTVLALSLATTALSFTTISKDIKQSTAVFARSKSVPFLDQPEALTGTLPGDVGFDPLNLTGLWGDVSSKK